IRARGRYTSRSPSSTPSACPVARTAQTEHRHWVHVARRGPNGNRTGHMGIGAVGGRGWRWESAASASNSGPGARKGNPMPTITAIYRYPVKGLGPDPLESAELVPGQTIAGDRLYAIENGPSGFDAAHPAYLPKSRFLMLMRNERLAALRTAFDQATHTLAVTANGGEAARGDLRTPEGRCAIEEFFAAFCADELRGPPKVLNAAGHSFSDVARKVLSIINLASL